MPQAKFVEGSILRHIVVMSATNAIGLTALFLVDLADLFFISLLGEAELAAAVGYAGTIAFFTTSISIGLSIAMTALVSRSIGQRDTEQAKRLVTNVLITGLMISCAVAALAWMLAPSLLELIGARGRTQELATQYLRILLPSMPILGMAMSAGAALRSVGDAKRAMWSTLAGGAANAVLDPIFIFLLGLGLPGAAIASVMARMVVAYVALSGLVVQHKLFSAFSFKAWISDQQAIFKVALPAMLTNVATPFGNAYVTATIAMFGDAYVAGWAIIGRLIPVSFGMIFSLSGAVGPIIGQNFGALNFDRVRDSLVKSVLFTAVYVVLLSLTLYLLRDWIVVIFGASDDAAQLIHFFCTWISISFFFNGTLFVANACFNNLGYPTTSTLMNIGKATIGTIPFVYFGSQIGGAEGVLAGQALGAMVFGVVGLIWAFKRIEQVRTFHGPEPAEEEASMSSSLPMTPFCSSRAYMCADAEVETDLSDIPETIQNEKV